MSGFATSTVLQPAARAAGSALGATAGLIGQVLHRVKPLHPDGVLFHATVSRVGTPTGRTGVPFLDEPGDSPAVVRISRAIGLPDRLPDIAGLALRVDPTERPGDLLLASTGTSRLGRFVLLPRPPGRTGALTTLLPYRTQSGPVLIEADPLPDGSYELRWAHAVGPWQTFALLHLGARYDGPDVSFDPVLNTLPGLAQYGWVRRLREPAYRTSRSQSGRTPAA